jgi:hypothetical protein
VRILFDHGNPAPPRHALKGHSVATAHEMGWSTLDNGELLSAAEIEFDVIVTTDQNIRHQHNLIEHRLAILVLPTTNWRLIRAHQDKVLAEINRLPAGGLVEIKF